MPTINTPTRGEALTALIELGEAVAVQGALIAVKSDGEGYKAVDDAGMIVVGINKDSGVEGDVVVVAKQAVLLKNDTGHPVTAANIGGLCYVHGTDGETVCLTAGSVAKLVAGVVLDVVAEGVWVDLRVQTAAVAST